ncbi:MAG: 3-hydroxyisobutyrate dehydrogenase [Pseudomonadota bacterium]
MRSARQRGDQQMTHVGFIGLGNMGLPMAANLAAAGHSVSGFDLAAANVEAARAKAITPAESAAAAVANADFVVTMLPAGPHVRSVWAEVVASAPKSAVLIDSSTIDVDSARAVHAFATEQGIASLDAPVSGGVGGAEAGTLTFMCGGDAEVFARATGPLEIMGGRLIRCGGAGAGQVAKLCNNMSLAIAMIGTSEAMNMGLKLGLDAQTLFDVMSTSSGATWALTHHCPIPGPVAASAANKDYKAGFSGSLMLKDLSLAQEVAKTADSASPLGALAMQLFRMHVNAGHGDLDYAAIVKTLAGETA